MTTNNVTAPEAIDGMIDMLGLLANDCNRPARTEVCAARAALERALILSLDWVDMIDDDRRCEALDTVLSEIPVCVELSDATIDAAKVEENEHDGEWARVTLGTTEAPDLTAMMNAVANLERATYLAPSQKPAIDLLLGLPQRTDEEMLRDQEREAAPPPVPPVAPAGTDQQAQDTTSVQEQP